MIRVGGRLNLAVDRHDDTGLNGRVPAKDLNAQAIFGHGLWLQIELADNSFEEIGQLGAVLHLQNTLIR